MNIMKLFLYLLAISSLILIGANIPHESKTYFENGQLSVQTSHKRGERHGSHKMYFPDGALFLSANYSDGDLDGVKLTYSPNGQIVGTETWVHGRLQSTSKPKKKKVRRVNADLNLDEQAMKDYLNSNVIPSCLPIYGPDGLLEGVPIKSVGTL